jgi:hypothetical protein
LRLNFRFPRSFKMAETLSKLAFHCYLFGLMAYFVVMADMRPVV